MRSKIVNTKYYTDYLTEIISPNIVCFPRHYVLVPVSIYRKEQIILHILTDNVINLIHI